MLRKEKVKAYNIAAYCRISVDVEADRDSTSIENQKAIIQDYVNMHFPDATVTFYVDRDRSGYTFEQREAYQEMRPLLMNGTYDTLIVKDLSRFSRRNSKGLVELEDLRDAGLRIIAIGDSVDYPTYDDWTNIRLRFLLNEMPITDSSQKVKNVIERRQKDGKWICSVPYGYVITNSKMMTYAVDESAAVIVRKIFELYNDGWGYKKITNYLTDNKIPTPRMIEKARIESDGTPCKLKPSSRWSIPTVSHILENDFYIGTLRQGKYVRKGINGKDVAQDAENHIIFENHHEPIVDYKTFARTQELIKKRTTTHYRGIKKYKNTYSGFMVCGDCGSPMFALSRADIAPAYVCGLYHRRGRKDCTSHHTRVDILDSLLKQYLRAVKENCSSMLDELSKNIAQCNAPMQAAEKTFDMIERQIEQSKDRLKLYAKQKIVEVMRKPEYEESIIETYDALEAEEREKLVGLQNQLQMLSEQKADFNRATRVAKTAVEIFDSIIEKDSLDKQDLEFIIEKITVYTDRIDIQLKADIDTLLQSGTPMSLLKEVYTPPARSRVEERTINVINEGDPLLTTLDIFARVLVLINLVERYEGHNKKLGATNR